MKPLLPTSSPKVSFEAHNRTSVDVASCGIKKSALLKKTIFNAAKLGTSAAVPKTILSKMDAHGAACVNGSPPAFYLDRSASKSTTWVVMFQGGGWAYTLEQLAMKPWNSPSNKAREPRDFYDFEGGPLSSDPDKNPTFWDANRVLIYYCDGGMFSGDLTDPLLVNDRELYVRGKRNMEAVFSALVHSEGMSSATEVLLSGLSAGALASIVHADHVRALLPDSVVKYGVMPISGFFLDHANENGVFAYGSKMRGVFEYQNSSAGLNAACLASKTAVATEQKASGCMFAKETFLHTDAPVFLINSALDLWQLNSIWLERDDYSSKCMADESTQFQSCTDNQISVLNAWASDFMQDLITAMSSIGSGFFIDTCLEHASAFDWGWKAKVSMGTGVPLNNAVAKWWATLGPCGAPEPTSAHSYFPGCTLQKSSEAAVAQCNPSFLRS